MQDSSVCTVHFHQDDLHSVSRAGYVADNVAVILLAGHWYMVLSLVSACQISAGSNKDFESYRRCGNMPPCGVRTQAVLDISNESITAL
jgi:hypothetical protein